MAWDSLKSIMPKALKTAGIQEKLTAVLVLQTAQRILTARWGADKAAMVDFVSFKTGCLKIVSHSPGAMQALRLGQAAFVNDLNRELGQKAVHKIDIRSQGF